MRIGLAVLAGATSLVWAATSQAQAATAASPCWDRAKTQMELNQCASSDATAADLRLNKAYQHVLGRLQDRQRRLLVAAQRAWIAFRDADCGFWGSDEGSIAPMNAANCVASLSNGRAKELEDWVATNAPE